MLLLLVAVLLPSAGVLWFMARAIDNERLAVRERLTQAYRSQLVAMQGRLEAQWHEVIQSAGAAEADKDGRALDALLAAAHCDSAILYDANSQVVYPRPPRIVAPSATTNEWLAAQTMEDQADFASAAAAFAELAKSQKDVEPAARALQAQVRCLLEAGQKEEALAVLNGPLADAKYANACDAEGRLIVPNAQLLALELMDDFTSAAAQKLQLALGDRVRVGDLPTAQRAFLAQRLMNQPAPASRPGRELWPCDSFGADCLALAAVDRIGTSLPVGVLAAAQSPRVWCLRPPSNPRVVLLFEESTILELIDHQKGADMPPPGTALLPHTLPADKLAQNVFLTVPAGASMPDWKLSIYMTGSDPFVAAAHRQAIVYLWIAVLLVGGFITAAALVGTSISRQMRITRLKNDLIATVSHELKTPLASMRVLVDTLLENRLPDAVSRQEYLQLMARENVRLSRLIDNFLSFSRMERNKKAFTFEPLRPAELVAQAVASAGERFSQPNCHLTVDVEADLAAVWADRDAIVTVILNLLDNAWKYTREDKRISISASQKSDRVHILVTDNGIGLTRRAAKKVFERFYQVDSSLSRQTGGVGLGLSIVKFIIQAHGGSVSVDSRLGHGSTFTISLPTAAKDYYALCGQAAQNHERRKSTHRRG